MHRPLLSILALLLALGPLAIAKADTETGARKVFIAGDSTASEYGPERAPREGWGQQLQSYLDANAYVVRNHAKSGRSSRSFIEEGWLKPVEDGLGPGDVLLIQFGHNDEKLEDPTRYNEPASAFPTWLQRYIDLAREHGATPILITPVVRRKFDHGQLLDTHGLYSQAVRTLAETQQVALIDLDARSRRWLRALGEEASKDYYMHVPAQGLTDDTHFQVRGATAIACLVVKGWEAVDPGLATHVIRDTDCADESEIPTALQQQPNPSLSALAGASGRAQPGPHGGAGPTTAYPLFADAPGLAWQVRRRVLHKGASIGLHLHHKDEVYYVLAGRGRYVVDGKVQQVSAGDALLVRPGSTHALQQDGDADLEILIFYGNKPDKAG